MDRYTFRLKKVAGQGFSWNIEKRVWYIIWCTIFEFDANNSNVAKEKFKIWKDIMGISK